MHPALDKWESSSEGVECLLMLFCVVTFVKQARTARSKSWRLTEVLQQQIGVDHLLLRIVCIPVIQYYLHHIYSSNNSILASSVVTGALLFWVLWLHMASPAALFVIKVKMNVQKSWCETCRHIMSLMCLTRKFIITLFMISIQYNCTCVFPFVIVVDWCGSWWGILLMQYREV